MTLCDARLGSHIVDLGVPETTQFQYQAKQKNSPVNSLSCLPACLCEAKYDIA